MIRACIALLLMAIAIPMPMPAIAQNIVVSERTEDVSLTIYRAPKRGQRPINKRWPQGYALITETRNISIPAGESLIRFEGVAEGMFPESAIVTGLPKGVSEKNRDARLLSPAGLVDAYLKRAVTISRTSKATGKTIEQEALITTGPNGIILETKDGFEALNCTGLPERLRYPGVPQDLSAKPTLSILTQSDRAVSAKVTLTYMAGGFDWQANYLVQMKGEKAALSDAQDKARDKASLFAWLTLANGGNQSFANANTMAIAGEPNRERRGPQARPTGRALQLKCWPSQRTHEVPFRGLQQFPGAFPSQPPPAAPMMLERAFADEVVVTASKRSGGSFSPVAAIKAEQENLGDLKLYRIPERVSVNAKGQKQVAMITQPEARFETLYTAKVDDVDDGESYPMDITLRGKNSKKQGLGLPMPSGQMQIFEGSNYGPLLVQETTLDDKAVDEKLELYAGQASSIRIAVKQLSENKRQQIWKVTLSNAYDYGVNAEVEIPYELRGRSKAIRRIDGIPTWRGTIPANDEISFTYRIKLARE